MPLILALDTSTEACSCAVIRAGDVSEDFAVIPRQHAARILPMVASLLSRLGLAFTDLDAVAFGRGPGSFTGLRIAAGVAQGIAFAADVPVIGVSTLAAQALRLHADQGDGLVLSCLDARIDEVYWGVFDTRGGDVRLLGEERLCRPEDMSLAHVAHEAGPRTVLVAGSGLAYRDRYPGALADSIRGEFPDMYPHAADIARLALRAYARGELEAPDDVRPVYLRDKVTRV